MRTEGRREETRRDEERGMDALKATERKWS